MIVEFDVREDVFPVDDEAPVSVNEICALILKMHSFSRAENTNGINRRYILNGLEHKTHKEETNKFILSIYTTL